MTTKNPLLSIVILTHNEQENIEECLESLAGLKTRHEILIIDDESTDSTTAIALKLGARVIRHALKDDFASQRNWALKQVKSGWVFFLDADERCTPAVLQEVHNIVANQDGIVGAYVKRYDYFGDRLLKHGEIGSLRLLRLAKRNSGLWRGKVDEVWKVSGKCVTLINPLHHASHPNITQFLESVNSRSTLNAKQLYECNRKVRWYDWGKPMAKFFTNYIIKLGFLDGLAGFIFTVLMSFHSFLVRGKLYLLLKSSKGK